MRPVTKGPKGTYPYTVDVTSQVNLDTSLAAIKIPFGGVATAKVNGVWTGAKGSPTASQVLDGLLMIAKDNVGGLPPAKKAKKKVITVAAIKGIQATLTSKLSGLYAEAASPLNVMLGRFCSFCELYNQTGVAVEHVTPKAQYPLFYIAWDNFLLACTVCNSNKLSKPPRDDAQFTPAPADEVGYFDEIMKNYIWPHKYSNVFKATKPQLEYEDKSTGKSKWLPVTYPVADGTERISADEVTRTITADVRADVTTKGKTKATWLYGVPVRVRVTATEPKAPEMVDLVKLNKPSGETGTQADIRVWTRTLQWFKVLDLLNALKKADATSFPVLWNVMMGSVQQPGLYSVWVTLIDLLGPGGSWTVPGTGTAVMDKFLATIIGQDYFPGTDTANTP